MSQKTITKFSAFVIFAFLVCVIFSGCFTASSRSGENSSGGNSNQTSGFSAPKVIAKIESPEIKESSGLVASRCNQGAFWTHNDSDDNSMVYAFNGKGEKLGTWKIAGAKNFDWEDMATFKTANGECFLYLGDIGNNVRDRAEFIIYRVREPKISDADKPSTKKNPRPTETAETIKITYPDMRHDAETLLVHPQTGDIYVVTKRLSGAAGVYKLAANYATDKTNTLEKVADFSVPAIPNGFLTGGDISPDGKRIVICDYFGAYEIALPEKAQNFDEIWKQKITPVNLGERQQGEAACYSLDGNSIFATSEKKNSPIIEVKRK
jgi:hypothetical protein